MQNLDFDIMPSVGLNIMIVGITTNTVRNVDGKSLLDFYVEENLGDREPRDFWIEASHDPNLRYLANKTNSINQTMRSTTAILTGVINYIPPVVDETTREETTPGKHVVKLEDISLVSTNRNVSNNQQTLNVPWLSSQSGNSGNNRTNRSPRGASPRSPRRGRGRTTLSQMSSTRNQTLSLALEANPIPTMTTRTTRAAAAAAAAATTADETISQEE